MSPTDLYSEDESITRPSDVENYGFGLPGGYKNAAQQDAEIEAQSHNRAMEYLKQSAQGNSYTGEQGIAAALLSALTTVGGYAIGRSVGMPNIPDGVTIPTSHLAGLGGAAGGAAGAQLGGSLADDYFKQIGADQQRQRDLAKAQAAMEEQNSQRAETAKNQIVGAGLNKQAEIDMLPQREASQIRIGQAGQNAILAREKAEVDQGLRTPGGVGFTSETVPLTPAQITEVAKSTGMDPSSLRTVGDANRAIRMAQEGGRNSRSANALAIKDRPGESTTLAVTEPIALGKDIQQSIGELQGALGSDPSLVTKAWSTLPLGSDAYNAMKQLQINGARAAKVLEGRVNETTLKLYTDLMTSINTEPLSAVIKRSDRFVQALNDDSKFKIEALGATGRDVEGLRGLLPTPTPSQGVKSSTLPSIGSTFQGKKVLSVTRIN